MADVKPTILRFRVQTTNPLELMSRFHPTGQVLLNRTTWMGKEPRSCGVTGINGQAQSVSAEAPVTFDVEVSYRPKGLITYIGGTRYDGWTAMLPDRKKDGTLLDGHGNPLPEGQPPVFIPYEVYRDTEFNDIDFGEFVEEVEVGGIRHLSFDEVMRQVELSGQFYASIDSTFVAPRRNRQRVKLILTSAPSGTGSDGFGTRIININRYTPHLQQVISDEVSQVMSGFLEGRYSITNMTTDAFVFAKVNSLLVDCTPNEEGKESRFDCLAEYVSENFLEELAQTLMSQFEVEISVVDGPKGGLLFKRPERRSGKGSHIVNIE